MFERFTQSARGVVMRSREEAHQLGHGWIGIDHVLVALAEDEGIAGEVLREAGVTAEALRDELARKPKGEDGDLDAEALRSIGIDLDDVRRAAERTFGDGALDGPLDRTGRPRGGHTPFTPDAKKALERAVRQTLMLGHRSIGSEHLLLGVLDESGPGVSLLTRLGVDPQQLRAATLTRARRSA